MNYASFGKRMWASVIDSLLSSVILIPIVNILNMFVDFSHPEMAGAKAVTPEQAIAIIEKGLPSLILQSVIIAAIVIIFWVCKSATPGKMFFKMKIVDAKTGEKPSKGQFIARYLGYILSTLPLGLGFIWIYYDNKKQGFHDKIAGTVVIIDK